MNMSRLRRQGTKLGVLCFSCVAYLAYTLHPVVASLAQDDELANAIAICLVVAGLDGIYRVQEAYVRWYLTRLTKRGSPRRLVMS